MQKRDLESLRNVVASLRDELKRYEFESPGGALSEHLADAVAIADSLEEAIDNAIFALDDEEELVRAEIEFEKTDLRKARTGASPSPKDFLEGMR